MIELGVFIESVIFGVIENFVKLLLLILKCFFMVIRIDFYFLVVVIGYYGF